MDHLSNSQINLYLQCSLKYKFQYVDFFPKPFKPSGLALGSAVHSALSWLNKERMNGNSVTLDRLYKIFDADWYSLKVDAEIRYKNGEEEMKLTVLAKELLGLYFSEPHRKVKGTEIPFVVPIVNPQSGQRLPIDLEGVIDLIEEEDAITEFKTSAQTMDATEVGTNLQLTIYSYAYEMLAHRPPKLLRIIDLVKAKKPKMIVLKTERGKADYERFFFLASQVLKGIRSQVFFPRSGFWCKDCEYGEYCRDWRGS
jgi:CRISPR/Cas system-associated exonuclease Cas4 (RecB family)